MSLIGSNILLGASGNQGGYQISRSVRLRAAASAYLNRTFTSSGNQQKWTLSSWFKFGDVTLGGILLTQYTNGENQSQARFGGNTARFYDLVASAFVCDISWAPVYRDPSAWYHVVFAVDTTQAINTNRIKFYVNGVQVTATTSAAWPAQNSNLRFNGNTPHFINQNGAGSGIGDNYRTEINFVNAQQLDPTSFGEFNAITGVWQPKKYAGTYGTNGFYLNFNDNSAATAAAIGKDYSGNGNNWTPNNISVTAGVTYDSMIDTPTPYADGGNGRGNYAVLNPLQKGVTNIVVAGGNLNVSWSSSASADSAMSNISMPIGSGQWYCEFTKGTSEVMLGIGATTAAQANIANAAGNWGAGNGYGYRSVDGLKISGGTTAAYGATYALGDVIGIAFDASAGTLTFYKNNVSQGIAYSGVSTTTQWLFTVGYQSGTAGGTNASFNFGQRPFTYTPPTGFKALNTQNLPASTIVNGAAYMAATLYTGNGATQSISNAVNGVSFQPDLVWLKARSAATSHQLFDSVRGVGKQLSSDLTSAEGTNLNALSAFNSNGFSLGTAAGVNTNAATYAAWQWKAGGTAVTNTAGSISSQVSANTSAGFSVVTYTGTGANATVGHGLGIAPKMVIVKIRNKAYRWMVYFNGITTANTDCLFLNETSAKSTLGTAAWQVSSMSSTVIGIGTNADTNENTSTFVAYCFAEVAGYSKFGSYTGNGSADGPFVFLGFRPRFVMIKRTDSTGEWAMFDSSRDTENVVDQYLAANSSAAEAVYPNDKIDFLSNGFKIRGAPGVINTNAGTYIFMAVAENPFSKALAR